MLDLGTLGGLYSDAYSINNHNEIVGWSTDGAGKQQGVLWKQGKKVNLGNLGACCAYPRSINDNGLIAHELRNEIVEELNLS